MRILVVNVNTTESMTAAIGKQAQAAAAPGTEIIALTPKFGAESVEGNFESHLAAVAVMDAVSTYPEPFDAVIQAGFGEHGREGLQEIVDVPVVDITEAAAIPPTLVGRSHPAVTTLTMWGHWDTNHWKKNAVMYRADWSIKPGGQAYRDLVLGKWRTEEHGTTDSSGQFKLRGFKGNYDVAVKRGSDTRTLEATLADGGSRLDVKL